MLTPKMMFGAAGAALLKKLEQLRLVAYPDSKGIPTIGYGHTAGVALHTACTEQDAIRWFAEDSAWAIGTVNENLTHPVTQAQFDALVIFTFNVGATGFTKSDLIKSVNVGLSASLCVPLFFHYISSGGQTVPGLINRRAAEAVLFVS